MKKKLKAYKITKKKVKMHHKAPKVQKCVKT